MRIEHWDVALNQGAYVGKTWAGKETEPYTTVPYFFSDIGDWTWFEYVGPGAGRVDIRGSMDERRLRGLLPRRRRQGDGLPRREPLGRGERRQGAHRLAQWRARRLTPSGRPRRTRRSPARRGSESRARDAIAAICRDAEAAFDRRAAVAGPSARRRGHARRAPDALPGRRGDGLGARPAGPGGRARPGAGLGRRRGRHRGDGPGRCRRRSSLGRAGILLVAWLLSRRPRPPTSWRSRSPPTWGTRRTSSCGAAPARCSPRRAMIERGGEERFAELWSRSAAQLLARPRPGRLLDAGHVRRRRPATSARATASPGTPTPSSAGRSCSTTRRGSAPGSAGSCSTRQLALARRPTGRRTRAGRSRSPDQTIRVQWCHGAPGHRDRAGRRRRRRTTS